MHHERNFGEETAVGVGGTTELVLTANALHQDVPWTILGFDESVMTVDGPVPLGPARDIGDSSDVDAQTSHSFLPAWQYAITGVAAGHTTLALELAVDGERIDVYELDIVVDG